MKDKLEPNMYVRTKNGNIRKIVELTNTKFIDEPDYYVDKVLIDIEQNEREDTIYMEKWLFNEDIVKASYNIIDILEKGDYVNGHRVEEIDFENEEIFTDSEYYCGIVEFCNIKSVITHEQMEQMAYKVGD